MCGIAGLVASSNMFSKTDLFKMMEPLKRRGPDNHGLFIDDRVGLLHTRLSILDLSPRGKQPMYYAKGGKEVVIIHNGEIYNFKELKRLLKRKGYKFHTNTDTEVIAASYLEWGLNAFRKFNGMWAVAVYDVNNKQLILSRDRYGIKPLYTYNSHSMIGFSSSLGSFYPLPSLFPLTLSKNALWEFLMFRYPIFSSYFNEVRLLPPSSIMIIDIKGEKLSYSTYLYSTFFQIRNYKKPASAVYDLLLSSVKYRLISDVPVGVILSGGLDSSLLTSLVAKLGRDDVETYNVRFTNSKFDEYKYAKKVSDTLGLPNYSVSFDYGEYMRFFDEYSSRKFEPVGVANEVVLNQLAKLISSRGRKVVLGGEGADELFMGYNRIFSYSLTASFNNMNFSDFVSGFVNKYSYWKPEELRWVPSFNLNVLKAKLNTILREEISSYEKQTQKFFLRKHLPILLLRADNAFMDRGVEARVPFLDPRLVNYALSLNWSNFMSKDGKRYKIILREIGKTLLPSDIVSREKLGFPIPFVEWKRELTNLIELDELPFKVDKYLLEKYIEKNLKSENNYDIQKVWLIYSFIKFIKCFGKNWDYE